MIHDLTGLIHTLAASMAILVGAVVFLRPKGGRWHRWLGYVYSLCMLTVIVTSFGIYRLTGRFNFFHGAAIASSISVGFGFSHAFLRKPKEMWYVLHFYWMSWSFIGLLAALVAEISTRIALPFIVSKFGRSYLAGFWGVVGVVTLLVVLVGLHLVNRHSPLRNKKESNQS
jgi:cytochrome b